MTPSQHHQGYRSFYYYHEHLVREPGKWQNPVHDQSLPKKCQQILTVLTVLTQPKTLFSHLSLKLKLQCSCIYWCDHTASHGTPATYIYTEDIVGTSRIRDIYYASANISVLAERYICPKGGVTSHSPSLFYKKIARIWTPRSSTHLHSDPNNQIFLWLLLCSLSYKWL